MKNLSKNSLWGRFTASLEGLLFAALQRRAWRAVYLTVTVVPVLALGILVELYGLLVFADALTIGAPVWPGIAWLAAGSSALMVFVWWRDRHVQRAAKMFATVTEVLNQRQTLTLAAIESDQWTRMSAGRIREILAAERIVIAQTLTPLERWFLIDAQWLPIRQQKMYAVWAKGLRSQAERIVWAIESAPPGDT